MTPFVIMYLGARIAITPSYNDRGWTAEVDIRFPGKSVAGERHSHIGQFDSATAANENAERFATGRIDKILRR